LVAYPRPPCRILLAITIVPVAVLAWLTWRIFEQDRALAQQTVRDRLERSADLIVAALERDLVQLEDQLANHRRHCCWRLTNLR
jgi:hypothetical protein